MCHARRVLFIGHGRALLLVRRWGAPLRSFAYTDDEAGRAAVCDRLCKQPEHWPLHVVVDTAEEQFRHEPLPNVGSADRKRLLDRMRRQLFPQVSYSTYLYRRQLACVSSLGVMTRFSLWADALRELPLAGVYSPPLLLTEWLCRRGLARGCILLISLHDLSGLRQSAFIDGLPYFARLLRRPAIPGCGDGTEGGEDHPAADWRDTVAHMREFLLFIGRERKGKPLTVVLMADSRRLAVLRSLVEAAGQAAPPELKESIRIREWRLRPSGRTKNRSAGCETTLFRCVSAMRRRHYAGAEDCRLWRRRRRANAVFRLGLTLLLITPVAVAGLLTGADANRHESIAYRERAGQEKRRLLDLLAGIDEREGLFAFSGNEAGVTARATPGPSAVVTVSPYRLQEWVRKTDDLRAEYETSLAMWHRLMTSLTAAGGVPGTESGLRWYELQWSRSRDGEQRKQEAVVRLRAAEGLAPARSLRYVESLARRWRDGRPPLTVSFSSPVPAQGDGEHAPPMEFVLRLTWAGQMTTDAAAGGDSG